MYLIIFLYIFSGTLFWLKICLYARYIYSNNQVSHQLIVLYRAPPFKNYNLNCLLHLAIGQEVY